MASKSRVLYTGVTNNLGLRVQQHKACVDPFAFTSRYRVYQLVYWEEFESIEQAIAREKRIKGWKRFKKLALIDAFNPQCVDFGVAPAQVLRRLRGSDDMRGKGGSG